MLKYISLIIGTAIMILQIKGVFKIGAGYSFKTFIIFALTLVGFGILWKIETDEKFEEKYKKNYGTIDGSIKDLTDTAKRYPIISLGGQNGARMQFGTRSIFGDFDLFVWIERDTLFVSTTALNSSGEIISKLVANEWIEAPANRLDRNFDDKAVEVIDKKGNVVLQVDLKDNIAFVSGIFYFRDKSKGIIGIGIQDAGLKDPKEKGTNIVFIRERDTSFQTVAPIFKYPSGLYKGERAKVN